MAQWARREGFSPTEVARLEKEPPNVAKQWAKDHGMSPKDFLDGVPDEHRDRAESRREAPENLPPVADRPVAGAPAVAGRIGGGGRGGRGGLVGGAGAAGAAAGADEVRPTWADDWCSPQVEASIKAAQSQQGDHRDERSLLDGSMPVQVTIVAEGTNTTLRMKLSNGVTGYFKPFDGGRSDLEAAFGHDDVVQPLHEYGAWRLANQMGPPWSELVPPTVLREFNGRMGSFQLERPGVGDDANPWRAPEWREAAFFDALIGQQDRHWQNYLMCGDRLTLIDHGYSFAVPGAELNQSDLVRERSRIDPGLTHVERSVLDRILSSSDSMGLAGVLEPHRVEALRKRASEMRARNAVLNAGAY